MMRATLAKTVGGKQAVTSSLTVPPPGPFLPLYVGEADFVALLQAKWVKYGLNTNFDKVLFWLMNGIFLGAGLRCASAGIVPPQIAFWEC